MRKTCPKSRRNLKCNNLIACEVIYVKELKGWPFELLEDEIEPLGEGPGAGSGMPC